jgi:hypothetical protein
MATIKGNFTRESIMSSSLRNRPKSNSSEYFLNIGLSYTKDDGTAGFMPIPSLIIALDKIQNITSKNPELEPLAMAIRSIQMNMEKLEAGEAEIVNPLLTSKLVFQVRKVSDGSRTSTLITDKMEKIFSETNSILIKKNKLSSIIPKDKNKIEIHNIINQRKIPHLVHFTNLKNLESILKNGLVPRLILENRNLSFKFNDDLRLEQCKEANCLSVSFPNYKMFYTCKSKNRSEKWVVLLIDPLILLEKEALFFRTNAAHSSSTSWLNKNKNYLMTAKAFGCMFDSERKNLLDYYPADAQAEILLLDVIEPHFIQSLVFQEATILHSDDIEFLKNLNINICLLYTSDAADEEL